MKIDRELLKGCSEMAVLRLLARETMYGYQLAKELERRSAGVLALGHGTLYPLLYNLESKGLISAERRPSDDGPDRKYYSVTDKGLARLGETSEQWAALVAGMARLLSPDEAEGLPQGA
jgi:PadR family transcriptional regulator PadR